MDDDYGWQSLPSEILIEIFSYLPTVSLVNTSAVCRWWRLNAREDSLWKEIFFTEFHSFMSTAPVCDILADEYGMIKRGCPAILTEIVEDFYYEIIDVSFSPNGSFYAVCGKDAMICLYESTSRLLIEERDLSCTLGWKSIISAQFSPDELCLLLRGEKRTGRSEVATFAICLIESCLHFISRLPSSLFSPWFNNEWIVSNDIYPISKSSPIVKSISHIQLYKRHESKKEALSNPQTLSLFKILNEYDEPFNGMVSPMVSSRFRRIIHMASEAKSEGKTLTVKLNEMELLDDSCEKNQIMKLRELLDIDERCLKCYLSNDECIGDDCKCDCHIEREEYLFIYGKHINNVTSSICFNIIDLRKVREENLKENVTKVEDPKPDDDIFSYLSRQTTPSDHEIRIDGRIIHLTLSPDHKTLYATINMTPASDTVLTELRSFDLQTMVFEPGAFYGGLIPYLNTKPSNITTANEYFLFSCTQNEVVVWSRVHHGPSLTRLSHPQPVHAVAAHPHAKLLLVAAGEQLFIWTPAFSE